MNRRGFIATLTALAGLALARIKAPAAPLRPGIGTLVPQEPITGLVETSKNLYVFTKNDRFTYTYTPDVGWQWLKDDRTFISPSDVKRVAPENFQDTIVLDTCKHCGAQAHPGYTLICCCKPS